MAGAPGLDADRYVQELTRRNLPGVRFTPTSWTPDHGVYKGRKCRGVHIEFTDTAQCELTRLNFELMDAARRVDPSLRFFADKETTRMFDLVNGTDAVRKGFEEGRPARKSGPIGTEAQTPFAPAENHTCCTVEILANRLFDGEPHTVNGDFAPGVY